MKRAFQSFQIFLLLCGVFGADEVKSVMEGDSVTLDPDPAQIKTFYLIEWRFGDPVIAQNDGNDISYPSHTDLFRDRLQLDQTGSLTIRNMKTKHSGLYQLQISHRDGTSDQKFNVTVYESSSSDAGEAEMKSFSLTEEDPVTLQTDVTQLHGDELIVWRFGDEGKLIAKADLETKSSPVYYDERFRDRLQLDQTGSLTITNTRITDSGFYSVKISSNKQTNNLYKRFTVTVSGQSSGVSSGAVAGIVVLLVILAAAAVAAAVIYHHHKISELRKLTLTVKEGEDVTLKNNKIKKDDHILWQFGGDEQQTLIAEIRTKPRQIITPDGRFRGRLELDETTGSLTITDTRTSDSGVYILNIRSSSGRTSQQIFTVTVNARLVVVNEGRSVHLSTGLTKLQTGEEIQWMIGDRNTPIAEIKGGTVETHNDVLDGRFRDRLQLNKETGDLTILKSRAGDAGRYKLKICSKEDTHRIYTVVIIGTIPMMGTDDSSGKRGNESATVEMQPRNEGVSDGVNEQEGKSFL